MKYLVSLLFILLASPISAQVGDGSGTYGGGGGTTIINNNSLVPGNNALLVLGEFQCTTDGYGLVYNQSTTAWDCVDIISSGLPLTPGIGAVNNGGVLGCTLNGDVLAYNSISQAWDCVTLIDRGTDFIAGDAANITNNEFRCDNNGDIIQWDLPNLEHDCVDPATVVTGDNHDPLPIPDLEDPYQGPTAVWNNILVYWDGTEYKVPSGTIVGMSSVFKDFADEVIINAVGGSNSVNYLEIDNYVRKLPVGESEFHIYTSINAESDKQSNGVGAMGSCSAKVVIGRSSFSSYFGGTENNMGVSSWELVENLQQTGTMAVQLTRDLSFWSQGTIEPISSRVSMGSWAGIPCFAVTLDFALVGFRSGYMTLYEVAL